MSRKNNRKKSSYSRKMRIDPKRLLSKRTRKTHEYDRRDRTQVNRLNTHIAIMPRRGDVWFADLGEHPDTSVQEGCRPVFVVSNDIGNAHAETVTVVPLTHRMKKPYQPTHVLIDSSDCWGLSSSMVLAEQVTTIGKPAFKNYVGKVSEAKTREIECAVKVHLGLWKDNQR